MLYIRFQRAALTINLVSYCNPTLQARTAESWPKGHQYPCVGSRWPEFRSWQKPRLVPPAYPFKISFSPLFFSPAYPFFLPLSAKLPQIFLQESSNFWKYADFRQAAGIPRNSKEIQWKFQQNFKNVRFGRVSAKFCKKAGKHSQNICK